MTQKLKETFSNEMRERPLILLISGLGTILGFVSVLLMGLIGFVGKSALDQLETLKYIQTDHAVAITKLETSVGSGSFATLREVDILRVALENNIESTKQNREMITRLSQHVLYLESGIRKGHNTDIDLEKLPHDYGN